MLRSMLFFFFINLWDHEKYIWFFYGWFLNTNNIGLNNKCEGVVWGSPHQKIVSLIFYGSFKPYEKAQSSVIPSLNLFCRKKFPFSFPIIIISLFRKAHSPFAFAKMLIWELKWVEGNEHGAKTRANPENTSQREGKCMFISKINSMSRWRSLLVNINNCASLNVGNPPNTP